MEISAQDETLKRLANKFYERALSEQSEMGTGRGGLFDMRYLLFEIGNHVMREYVSELIAQLPEIGIIIPLELTHIDRRTGLMWTGNGHIGGMMGWKESLRWVKKLNYAGYSDWRLPTVKELAAFTVQGGNDPSEWFNAHGFIDVQGVWRYWVHIENEKKPCQYFLGKTPVVSVEHREYLAIDQNNNLNSVWPVRDAK